MEFAKSEITAVREVAKSADGALIELTELELVRVGGGTGDVQLG
jgi:hypothetical protein